MRNIGEPKGDKVISRQKQLWKSRKWNGIQREVPQTWGRSTQVAFYHVTREALLPRLVPIANPQVAS